MECKDWESSIATHWRTERQIRSTYWLHWKISFWIKQWKINHDDSFKLWQVNEISYCSCYEVHGGIAAQGWWMNDFYKHSDISLRNLTKQIHNAMSVTGQKTVLLGLQMLGIKFRKHCTTIYLLLRCGHIVWTQSGINW